MELEEVVARYAEALQYVDAHSTTQRANRRTGEIYAPGLPTLGEEAALDEADAAWETLHPGEITEPAGTRLNIKYPTVKRAKCDHVFSTIPGPWVQPEWAVEAKFVSFIGANGRNNDYGVGKILSPYLKDRGVLHDAARLREHGFTRRVAVMLYAFNYDSASCDTALDKHPDAGDVVHAIRDVIKSNGAPLHARPVVELVDAILGLRGYLRGPRAEASFTAWRNPTGGNGTVYGWEIRRPQLEPDYDPRHPW